MRRADSMTRTPLDLPSEFLDTLKHLPPPAYKDHAPDECGACVHLRLRPKGLPVPPLFEDTTDQSGRPVPGLASTYPVVRKFYAGLGHCTLNPGVPGTYGVPVHPTTHVSWTCQWQTTPADLDAAQAQIASR